MKHLLIIFSLLLTSVSWGNDIKAGNEFEAMISYKEFNLYKVELSPFLDIKWIKTIACIELLVMDDVLIQPFFSGKNLIGGVFKVIDKSKDKSDWEECIISKFYKYKPEE